MADLRELAGRLAALAVERAGPRAILLTGSVARDKLALAPPRLYERLLALASGEIHAAVLELEALVEETAALVTDISPRRRSRSAAGRASVSPRGHPCNVCHPVSETRGETFVWRFLHRGQRNAPISAPPATTRSAPSSRWRPTSSVRRRSSTASSTAKRDSVATSGLTTVTRER